VGMSVSMELGSSCLSATPPQLKTVSREREAVLEALDESRLNRWQTMTRNVSTARPSLCR
jgi:hypothetical protein